MPTPPWMQRGYDAKLMKPLHVAYKNAEWARQHPGRKTDVDCPVCRTDTMTLRVSKNGLPFLGCSSYPECEGSLFCWGRQGELTPGECPGLECYERDSFYRNPEGDNPDEETDWFNQDAGDRR